MYIYICKYIYVFIYIYCSYKLSKLTQAHLLLCDVCVCLYICKYIYVFFYIYTNYIYKVLDDTHYLSLHIVYHNILQQMILKCTWLYCDFLLQVYWGTHFSEFPPDFVPRTLPRSCMGYRAHSQAPPRLRLQKMGRCPIKKITKKGVALTATPSKCPIGIYVGVCMYVTCVCVCVCVRVCIICTYVFII